jgi:predicted nucleic acid-binding protein
MPTSADPDLLVDTSVAVALIVADHERHGEVAAALQGHTLGLAGHAAFETFSVLTLLPAPLRRSPASAAHLLAANFPASRFLDEAASRALLERLPELSAGGGDVYDALVGACAVHHGLPLASRDRRAVAIYRALEVDLRIVT